MPEEVDPLSVPGWLLRGAIREDDLGFLFFVFCFRYGDDPHDDPYGPFWRVMQSGAPSEPGYWPVYVAK